MIPASGVDVLVFNEFAEVCKDVKAISLNIQVISSNRNGNKGSKEFGPNRSLIIARKVGRHVTLVLVIKENAKPGCSQCNACLVSTRSVSPNSDRMVNFVN